MATEVLLASDEQSTALMELELGQAAIPGLEAGERLSRGAVLATWDRPYPDLAPELVRRTIVFCRRIMPVEGRLGDVRSLVDEAWQKVREGGIPAVSVQAWGGAGGLGREIAEGLSAKGITVSGQAPDVLSVYRTPGGELLYGFSAAADNRSPYPAGAVRLAARDTPSRSARKLEEAFALFHLPGGPGRALDIGAAPGGWSMELLRRGYEVTAVDRAPLALPPSPGLEVLKGDIRDVAPRGPFDLVVCDANGPYRSTVSALLGLTPSVRPGAFVLVTVKFGKEHPLAVLKDARLRLSKAYRVADGRQLFHNRREATLLLQRKAE